MKRIIITERQYKRLVDQPLNEQKTKGGKIILPRDESIYNVRDNNAKMYLLLQWVSRYLGSKYNENLHIKDISDSDITIDLSKYKKKVINYIEYQIRSFMKVYGKILTYNKESGEMYFKDEPEEVENTTIDEPEEGEGERKESFHDNGKLKTQGTIKDGLPHGEWKQYYENGQLEWQGQYVNGIMDGEWKSYHDNGQLSYARKYVNGEMEGEWKHYYDNGQLEMEGKYANGKEEGEWKYYLKDGNVDKIEVYEDGELVDEPEGSTGCIKGDCENGQGTYNWVSGSKYVGEYKDGKRNGQGTFTWADGEKYVGEWKDGKRNGQGTYTWANGNKYVGEYKDGKRNGQGTKTYTNGAKYEGEWKDGKFVGEVSDDSDGPDEVEEVIDVSEDTSFVLPIPNDNIKVVGRHKFLISPANEKVDVEYVFDFFKGKGLKDYQACGILGNIFHESVFNTGIIGDGGKSLGIVQWHKSRLKKLSQFSKIKERLITDKDLQLGFLWNELNGTYSYVLKKLTDSTTIKEASFEWASKFEVCAGCQTEGSPTNKKRLEKGQVYLEKYAGGEVEIVPDVVPDIPFRNKTEGNSFRKWVNDNHKEYADKIDLDPTGHWKEGQKHFKGYMLKAWNKYGKEYVDGDYYEELEEISSNDGGCELSKCQFRVEGGGCKPFDDLSPDSKNRIGGGLNFDKIPDGKNNFRSAAPSAEQMLYILQNNPDIKKIISFDDGRDDEEMRNDEEKKFIECYNDKYGTTIKWVRVDAEKGIESGKGYVGTLNNVLPSLGDGDTLIHCTHGADRTGYVVAKHLKDVKGWSNEKLWDYTVEYNSWEGKSGYICKGTEVKYLNYLEGFYPLSEWCKKDKNKDCPSCKK